MISNMFKGAPKEVLIVLVLCVFAFLVFAMTYHYAVEFGDFKLTPK